MIVSADQVVSIHTKKGVQLFQFQPSEMASLKWAREMRQVSKCTLDTSSSLDYDRIPEIIPWFHWVSVYDEYDKLLWTGPILKMEADRVTLSLDAVDISTFLGRTRNPITKKWDATDPGRIAELLWNAMIEAQGLNTAVVAMNDPHGGRFDFATNIDEQMLDATMDKLVDLGLKWTMVANVPVLGPASIKPIVTLNEDHFLGNGPKLVRDGTKTYNDVLLKGADSTAQSRFPLASARVQSSDLNLQTMVNVDSMFGVTNVRNAVYQYARFSADIRNSIVMPNNTKLHPDAPVEIEDLIPSVRIGIEAFGLQFDMELQKLNVELSDGDVDVKVDLEPYIDLPELAISNRGNSPFAISGVEGGLPQGFEPI